MKKTLLCICSLFIFAAAFCQKVTFTNTIGGDKDKLEGNDLFNTTGYGFSSRTQLDYDSKYLYGRMRYDIYKVTSSGLTLNLKELQSPDSLFRWYTAFTPCSYITIAAGNSFFSKYGAKSTELYALDDTPNYGKLLKNGVGILGSIPFNKDRTAYLKLSAGLDFIEDLTTDGLLFDAGAEFNYKDYFSAALTARNLNKGEFGHYSITAGGSFGGFKINAGFIYNNTDEDVFYDQTTGLGTEAKYSAAGSILYKNKKLRFTTALDTVIALNSDYIAAGSRKTKTYSDGAIPFLLAFRFDYKIIPELKAQLKIKYTDMFNREAAYAVTVYPNCEYNFKNSIFSISGGLRIKFYMQSGYSCTDFTVPVTFTLKYRS